MKPIIIYFSMSGTTKSIALAAAKELQCDAREIIEAKKRSKAGAYVWGAFAALRGKASEIMPMDLNLEANDPVFVVTPVWASSPVPATNAFIAKANLKGKRVVLLFCTASGEDAKAASIMTEKIHAKGGMVLQHHVVKTSGATETEMADKVREIIKLYR